MTSRRITVALLVGVFASPFGAGWLLYLFPQWLPDRRSNHGELIEPVVPITRQQFVSADRTVSTLNKFRGQWVLLLRAGTCDRRCHRAIWNMRQVRLALGADRRRLERVLMIDGPPSPPVEKLLHSDYPGMWVVFPTRETQEVGMYETDTLYVIDPMGNQMMRYRMEANGKAILEDMKRLMKLSENWGSYGSN